MSPVVMAAAARRGQAQHRSNNFRPADFRGQANRGDFNRGFHSGGK
jgi:hypothetical protein